MPISGGKYVAPTWVNGTSPAIDQAELQAMCNTLACIPIANGGTGATTASDARTALGIGSVAVYNSPLPVENGGTGATSAAAARTELGLTGIATATIPLSVANGGTGNTTNTSNSVLVGNGTSAVKNIASANGALYATSANGAPSFGTLPIAQGGTGATTAANAITNLGLGTISTLNSPLPVANGGTGATAKDGARTNLGITSGTDAPSGGANGDIYFQYSA